MTNIYVVNDMFGGRAAFLDHETADRVQGLWGENTSVWAFTDTVPDWFSKVKKGQICYKVEMTYRGECGMVLPTMTPVEPRFCYERDGITVVILAHSESDARLEAEMWFNSVSDTEEFKFNASQYAQGEES